MSPIPADYVDVAERIRMFYERYPDGSLQSWVHPELFHVGDKTYVACGAAAFRHPEDKLPGVGWAWEPVPGPTPFTRDSELMNAETSAWGRAIVALGFETKKIASADEVRNRQGSEPPVSVEPDASNFQPPPSAAEKPNTAGLIDQMKVVLRLLNSAFPEHPGEGRTWQDVAREYRLDRWPDKKELADLSVAEANELNDWLEEQYNLAAKEAAVPFGS